MTGAGSARPVVSISTRRSGPISRRGARMNRSLGADQISHLHAAADAAGVEDDEVFVDLLDQMVIDADRAELVDDAQPTMSDWRSGWLRMVVCWHRGNRVSTVTGSRRSSSPAGPVMDYFQPPPITALGVTRLAASGQSHADQLPLRCVEQALGTQSG